MTPRMKKKTSSIGYPLDYNNNGVRGIHWTSATFGDVCIIVKLRPHNSKNADNTDILGQVSVDTILSNKYYPKRVIVVN